MNKRQRKKILKKSLRHELTKAGFRILRDRHVKIAEDDTGIEELKLAYVSTIMNFDPSRKPKRKVNIDLCE